MAPICIKEGAFILNATVEDAAFDVCTEESPRFFVVFCSYPKRRTRERDEKATDNIHAFTNELNMTDLPQQAGVCAIV